MGMIKLFLEYALAIPAVLIVVIYVVAYVDIFTDIGKHRGDGDDFPRGH